MFPIGCGDSPCGSEQVPLLPVFIIEPCASADVFADEVG